MRVDVDGEALRKLRRLHGLAGADLARSVGITPSGLGHVEQGRRQSVSGEVFLALVKALDVEDRPDWLMPAAEVRVPGPRSSTSSRFSSGIASGTLCEKRASASRTAAA